MHHDGAVDPVQEGLRGRRILRDDRIRVVRAVAIDEIDRVLDAIHQLHRDNRLQILSRPVRFGRRDDAGIDRARAFVAAHLAAGAGQVVDDARQLRRRHRAVDQQGFRRAADAGAPHLGVEHDVARHVGVGLFMQVDVADALEDAPVRARGFPPSPARSATGRRAAR